MRSRPSQTRAGPRALKLLQIDPTIAYPMGARRIYPGGIMTPIMDPPLIALSAKFALIHDRNRVVLIQADRDPAVVGEHFGAPVIAAISFDERWCVTAGCGVVVYDLNDPFEGFESGRPSHQWWEIGRDLEQPWFVEQLYLVDEDRFRFVVDLDGPAAGLYEMHVPRGELRRILFPPDDDESVPA